MSLHLKFLQKCVFFSFEMYLHYYVIITTTLVEKGLKMTILLLKQTLSCRVMSRFPECWRLKRRWLSDTTPLARTRTQRWEQRTGPSWRPDYGSWRTEE